ALATSIALPLAWLVTRTKMWGQSMVTLLGVIPLAVPGYVMAYALMAATGQSGFLGATGLPRASGFWGATLALGVYTSPYMFLSLRAALKGLDPSLEDAARTFGMNQKQVAHRVVLPQLRPAFLSGGLLISLHALGDFGVVSLMRFETFSYAIYLQYSSAFDRTYAAWLALMLLVMTAVLLFFEAKLLKGKRFSRTGSGAINPIERTHLGRWSIPAFVFVAVVGLVGVVVPISTILYWLGQGFGTTNWMHLAEALLHSCMSSMPAAALAGLLALPIAYLAVRKEAPATRFVERITYLGYSIPPLAFALALIFFSLRTAPFLYQSLGLLIIAYAIHFLPEAYGPIRNTLYQAPPEIEEAGRSLGRPPVRAFLNTTFPLLRPGIAAGLALTFLSAIKELPITFLLSPLGFHTLPMRVWSAAGESLFGLAAPYARLSIVASSASVWVLLSERKLHY
ncbi:MAG: iron ABC transporter permease, partial [Rubricoccaceae bacterium]|nr:iron ABC transporter permease [Rubricoccaceae bacterium]